jgi:ABC-2 type transport system permease protein
MNIIKVEIRRLLKSLFAWTIVLAALQIMFMAFFPSMKSSGMSALMKTELDAIPEALRTSFGLSSFVDFSDLLQYFAYCWQYVLLAMCVFAAITGANSLIKEESEGTIEFLYAKPVSRAKIAACKLVSTFSVIFMLNLSMFFVNAISLGILRDTGYNYIDGLVKITLTSLYACAAFWAMGFASSALLKNVSQASPCAMAIFFITYIFGILAPLVKNQNFMKYLSPYGYVLPSDILSKGTLQTSYAVILAVITISGITAGITVYRKKDFHI